MTGMKSSVSADKKMARYSIASTFVHFASEHHRSTGWLVMTA
jgi:hypothetical protein